jgi:hypothetical protein
MSEPPVLKPQERDWINFLNDWQSTVHTEQPEHAEELQELVPFLKETFYKGWELGMEYGRQVAHSAGHALNWIALAGEQPVDHFSTCRRALESLEFEAELN